MSTLGAFATPAHWLAGPKLAKVVSVQDPQSLSRVQVTLYGADPDGEAPLWARVAVPFAGDNRGAFLIPDVGDEVLVVFLGDDTCQPVVIGALWNGSTSVPEQLGGGGDRVDRWAFTGKNGTRIAIVEESSGTEKVEIETPGGVKATLTDEAGGSIKLEAAGSTFTMNTQGVSIETGATFSVSASQVQISSGMVTVDSAMSRFSGVVQVDTALATTVVGTTYTPGAGNVW